MIRGAVDCKMLVFQLLVSCAHLGGAQPRLPGASSGQVRARSPAGVRMVGGLGHCKQTHRKGRFILLRVSQEGI